MSVVIAVVQTSVQLTETRVESLATSGVATRNVCFIQVATSK